MQFRKPEGVVTDSSLVVPRTSPTPATTNPFLFITDNYIQPKRIVGVIYIVSSYVQLSFLSFPYPVGEDAVEDEAEENPIVLEFQQEREAFYIKDPKKALQGFFDREGM